MITLHQIEDSPFCEKICRLLHWKKIPYESVEYGAMAIPKIKKLNLTGKVPVLTDGSHCIPDSSAIARYIDKTYPESSVYPGDDKGRALCHVLEDWADESLYFMEMAYRFNIPANAKYMLPLLLVHDPKWTHWFLGPMVVYGVKGILKRQGTGRKSWDDLAKDLQAQVTSIESFLDEQDFLINNQLSMADISVFVQMKRINLTPEGAGVIGRSSRVLNWMQRIDQLTHKKREKLSNKNEVRNG